MADLSRFCVLEWTSGNGTCSRLRVDLDRLCITPLPGFWVKFEGRAFGFRLALEVEGPAVVVAGVRTGEARIGVNGVNLNGEAKAPRALRTTSSLLCVCTPLGVGWSESSCNRGAEGLSSSVGAGIEWTSVAIPLTQLATNSGGLRLGYCVRVRWDTDFVKRARGRGPQCGRFVKRSGTLRLSGVATKIATLWGT